MELFSIILSTQATLVIYFVVGIVIRKLGVLKEESLDSFAEFVLNVTLPCAVVNSFSIQLTPDAVTTAVYIFFASIAVQIGTALLGKLLYRKYPYERRSVMQLGLLISNCTFAGMPLVGAIYGEIGILYASIAIIPYRVSLWTYGIAIFTEADLKTKIKKILLNPCLIACWIGGFRMLLEFPVPALIDGVLAGIGNCTAPVSMMLVGALLAGTPLRSLLDKDIANLCAVRLIVIPLLVHFAAKALGVGEIVHVVLVLLAAMPLADVQSIFARKYNADVNFATGATLVSTFLSLITVPLMALLF